MRIRNYQDRVTITLDSNQAVEHGMYIYLKKQFNKPLRIIGYLDGRRFVKNYVFDSQTINKNLPTIYQNFQEIA